MTPTQVVTDIVGILTAGISNFATALGGGIMSFARALAFEGTGENEKLSVYFILVLTFAAIALVIGLTQKIFAWLTSLGN